MQKYNKISIRRHFIKKNVYLHPKNIIQIIGQKNKVMKVFAFAKEPKVKPGMWYFRGYYGDEEKAERRTIYEAGKVITIENFPDKYKKFVAYTK